MAAEIFPCAELIDMGCGSSTSLSVVENQQKRSQQSLEEPHQHQQQSAQRETSPENDISQNHVHKPEGLESQQMRSTPQAKKAQLTHRPRKLKSPQKEKKTTFTKFEVPEEINCSEFALPSCIRYRRNNIQLPVINKRQLAEHNQSCQSSKDYENMWTLDTEFVYHSHKLVEYIRHKIMVTYENDKERFLCYNSHYHSWKTKEMFDILQTKFSLYHHYSLAMFYMRGLGLDYEDMRKARCQTVIGRLAEEPNTDDETQEILVPFTESPTGKTSSQADDDLRKVALRQLTKLSQYVPPFVHSGDLNNLEFTLPDDITQNDLRPWITSWECFDHTIDENGYVWKPAPEDDFVLPDTHEVFSELVSLCHSAYSDEFDTTVDGEVAWKTAPLHVIKNDEPTDKQLQILAQRQQKHPLSSKQKREKHLAFLSRLEDKYELSDRLVSRYRNWSTECSQGWKDFQKLCETWDESQRPVIIRRELPNSEFPKTKQDNFDVEDEVSGVWTHFFSEKANDDQPRVFASNVNTDDDAASDIWTNFISGRNSKIQPTVSKSRVSALFGTDCRDDDEQPVSVPAQTRKRIRSSKSLTDKLNNLQASQQANSPTNGEDEKSQLELVKDDILKDSPHCSSTNEDTIKLLERSMEYPTGRPKHFNRAEDFDAVVFSLPHGVQPEDLRPNLLRSAKRTICPESRALPNNSTFHHYQSPLSPCLQFAETSIKITSAPVPVNNVQQNMKYSRKSGTGHKCCRSPDLICVECRTATRSGGSMFRCYGKGWQTISPWSLVTRFSWYDPEMMYVPKEPTWEQRAKRRTDILDYYAKEYKSKYDLKVYEGWAERMRDSWAEFQKLCDS